MSLNAVRRYAFSGRSRTVAYWVCTTLVLFELCLGGAWDILRVPQVRELMDGLGYPSYVLLILGVWKLLGAVALAMPRYARLKECAYAGSSQPDWGYRVARGVTLH
jgi:hypothetical protein